MNDRRRITSRPNLGDHVPDPIDPNGSVVLTVRVSPATAAKVRQAADDAGISVSQFVRFFLDRLR
jgi:hypothetical protein